MLTYKDRAWCERSKYCNNTDCSRLLTDEEAAKADKWAEGLGFTPILFTDLYTEDCGFEELRL